jgi:hypothetical protein
MRILNRKPRFAAVLRRYARAERALCENSIAEYAAGIFDEETPEFLAANREAYEARNAVPRWLWLAVSLIEWRIITDLDYWRRTGQS